MDRKIICIPRRLAWAATGLLFLVTSGCSTAPPPKGQGISASPSQASTSLAGSRGVPRPTLGCYGDRVMKAPAPFHLSWKLDDSSGDSDWEADVSANTIDGTWTNSAGTRKIHGVRADPSGWSMAVATFPLSSQSGHFRLLYGTSAIAPAGHETVNGYDTTKYTIDTSHASAADAVVFRSAVGAKGYIIGTAWADKEGCVVKFSLDEAFEQYNGTLDKEHLEGGMTKQ
ncbi:MAG: hypothetical protein ACYDDI_07400 [Candidatus Acidiferrales bacterium]